MKRLALFSVAILLLCASCATGPAKDIRVGKSFGVITAEKVIVHSSPSLQSQGFLSRDLQEFIIEDVTCADGISKASCWTSLAGARSFPQNAAVAFYKVKFKSGEEGFVNARYFFPGLSEHLTDSDGFKKFKDLEEKRREAIDAALWTDEMKKSALAHELKIGMNIEQVRLALGWQGSVPKVVDAVTGKGVAEKLSFRDIVCYFEDGILVKWKKEVKEAVKP